MSRSNVKRGIHKAKRSTITVYPKKYAHGFCFAVLCCGYTLTDCPISIRLTSLALWQSNDCPSASKATLMNMDKYFMWIHYERLHNHNKAKHNKTVCIFLGIYCRWHWNIGLKQIINRHSFSSAAALSWYCSHMMYSVIKDTTYDIYGYENMQRNIQSFWKLITDMRAVYW